MIPFKNLIGLAILFNIALSEIAFSQSNFYTFKITEPGVYQITAEEAKKLGASTIEEVAIFGYPGMLPQKLDQSQLSLQEIPSLILNGSKYFYLEGPHVFQENEEIGWEYKHHLYSDSLSYVIHVSHQGKLLEEQEIKGTPKDNEEILFQLKAFKGEEKNILNSGREWYSEPIFPGSSKTISVFTDSGHPEKWKLFGKLMASSVSNSIITVLADDKPIYELPIDAIPTSTYGAKGKEEFIYTEFTPTENRLERIRFPFQSADLNAMAYWNYIAVAIPFSSFDLAPGIYYHWKNSSYSIKTYSNLQYWDVSNFYHPVRIKESDKISISSKKLAVFNPSEAPKLLRQKLIPVSIKENLGSPSLLIITTDEFSFAANKLKSHKTNLGINTEVVFLKDIYNSFSYGNKDITGIRNFIAKIYQESKSLKNVLILGKGTFDYKGKLGGRPNIVPTYSSRNSLDPLKSYSSDDYYALIDFGQGMWEETLAGDESLQIGIGRLPIINKEEANLVVDKIINYENSSQQGFWKKDISFFADDGDKSVHMQHAESFSSYLNQNNPEIHQNKLYLDRFEQTSAGESQTSFSVKDALQKTLDDGTLILNYIGHGNESTLTHEEVFQVKDIENWPVQKKLALWVTATCEFGRHDNPFLRSAAEELLIAPNKGAIGLLSTGRPVFSNVNFSLNQSFIRSVFQSENGIYQDLGEIYKQTKNQSLNGSLNRNFSLIGDPSLKLANPELSIEVTSIQDKEGNSLENIHRTKEVILEALLIDPLTGATQFGFEGTYELEILGKPVETETLGDENNPFSFSEDKTVLFRGSGIVSEGEIKSTFILPKGIDEAEISGKIRLSAQESKVNGFEAFGYSSAIISNESGDIIDSEGPAIEVFANGTAIQKQSFPSKSLNMELVFEDSSGIDISGQFAGRNILIQVNNGEEINLNQDFVASDNSYKKGQVSFFLTGLEEGKNQILIQAWDNLGNQSILSLEILIEGSERFRILNYQTYPNPTNDVSNFVLEHNRPGENIQMTISVFQTTGQAIYSDSFRLINAAAKIEDISWIFLQNQTKYPAKGTYIYKITLQTETDNSMAVASGQIVIK
ncbi:type IX secretion system sortase PorU [Algoriphagus machipongonensis]|uniref:Gingipain domain-containing protein n=1 Tax=Algoriphagus machipongonensis TaxID=388413 RepID=A3I371_9BACT|nr:type IX secretion system sortase PorU [Algoriphagus machipongonensis]EAZ79097.1 hypothetical protein ALPR1_17248 [Algoriphagus machipongonensis]